MRVLLLAFSLVALPTIASAQPPAEPVPADVEPPAEMEHDFTTLLAPDHPLVETLPNVRIRRTSQSIVRWRMHFLVEILRSTERLF